MLGQCMCVCVWHWCCVVYLWGLDGWRMCVWCVDLARSQFWEDFYLLLVSRPDWQTEEKPEINKRLLGFRNFKARCAGDQPAEETNLHPGSALQSCNTQLRCVWIICHVIQPRHPPFNEWLLSRQVNTSCSYSEWKMVWALAAGKRSLLDVSLMISTLIRWTKAVLQSRKALKSCDWGTWPWPL